MLLLRLLALNVCGAGVFLIFIAIAYSGVELMADPVPHALVLTGIVVAVSATAMALALGRRLAALNDE
jgi:multicomponent Na+:H+ antiporter subunit C